MSSNVRWLGPYAPTERFADSTTIDHIISLRKQLEKAETERQKLLQYSRMLWDENFKLRYKLWHLEGKSHE